MADSNKQVYSGIGGQAILEGIMMRNKNRYAAAVRKPDGEIVVKEDVCSNFADSHKWASWPFIRGIFSFVDSLKLGMGTLMWSASFSEDESASKEKNISAKDQKNSSDSLSTGEKVLTLTLAVVIAIAVFSVLPTVLSNLLKKFISSELIITLIEGLLRLGLFIVYVAAISLMEDIRRVYMYHGSEHKCINCVEHGLPLTVENVMKSSKEHKRCGTSFLLIVMLISIILFMFFRIDNIFLRILSRILLIPVIAGISYELLRFTGRYDNRLTWLLSRPGMWLQGLTTREPDEDMAEVAIAAVERVFDWRTFLKENFGYDDIQGT